PRRDEDAMNARTPPQSPQPERPRSPMDRGVDNDWSHRSRRSPELRSSAPVRDLQRDNARPIAQPTPSERQWVSSRDQAPMGDYQRRRGSPPDRQIVDVEMLPPRSPIYEDRNPGNGKDWSSTPSTLSASSHLSTSCVWR